MTAYSAVLTRRSVLAALLSCAALPATAQDQTVSGNLTVTGDADIGGNTFSFGTRSDSSTTPGLNLLYGDSTPATLYFNATRNGAHWLWQQNSTSPQMKLTSTNQLLLYSTTNSTTPAVTLDPAGTSTFAGPVQFQGTVAMNGSSVTNLNASNITAGILPIANGGTGTSTPGLIAGSDVTITGTWPNQTISLAGNGVLPSFTGLTGYALVSDGTSVAWTNSLGIGLTSGVIWGGLGAGREWLIGGIDGQGAVGSVFGTYDGSIIIHTAGPDGTIQNWGEALFYEGAVIEGNTGVDSLNLINGASLRFDDEVVLSRTADATTLAAGGVNQHLILKPSGTGNVGIGTSAPAAELHIATSTGAGATTEFIRLAPAGGSNTSGTASRISSYSDVLNGYVDFRRFTASGPNTGLVFGTYGGDLLTLRSGGAGDSGNVGIGTTSPTTKLDVAGSAKVSGSLTVAGNVTFQGTATMNGGSVTNLNADNITTGVLPVARGGTGTSSPSLVAGSGINITGTWPNQTVAFSGSSPTGYNYDSGTENITISSGSGGTTIGSSGRISLNAGYHQGVDIASGELWLNGSPVLTSSGTDFWMEAGGIGRLYTEGEDTTIGIGSLTGRFRINSNPGGTPNYVFEAGGASTRLLSAVVDISSGTLQLRGVSTLSKDANGATTLESSGTNQNLILKPTGTGNVGIGTSSPSKKLTLLGSGYSARVLLDTPDTTSYPGFEFRHAGNDAYRAVVRSNYATGGGADLQFFTSGNLGAPVMLMDKSGNVGIGTTTPTAKLDVAGSAKVSGTLTVGGSSVLTQTALANSNTWTAAQNFQSGVNVTSGALSVTSGAMRSGSGQNLYLQPNAGAVTAMTLATNGYVGIGTTGPAYALDVAGANDVARFSALNGWAGILLTKSNGQTWAFVSGNNGNTNDFAIEDRTAGRAGTKSPFTIRHSDGNVGVGTSNPRAPLTVARHVSGGLGPVLALVNTAGNAGAGASIDFNGYDAGLNPPSVRIQSIDDGNFSAHFAFLGKEPGAAANALAERMRLTSTGRLLVGTPTDDGSTRLQVDGSVKTSGTLTAAAINAPSATVASATLTTVTASTATVNTMSVKTVLRVAPAGDLAMGEFTSGTNPAN